MSDTSHAVVRTLALTLVTVVFAGVWQNDRPSNPLLAQYLPADQRCFLARTVRVQEQGLVWQAPRIPRVSNSIPGKAQGTVTAKSFQKSLNYARTISIDAADLVISGEQISRHIGRLPLGMAAGSYRIVDAGGGVGWLHIVDSKELAGNATVEECITSTVEQDVVRFIRVQDDGARTASGNRSIIK